VNDSGHGIACSFPCIDEVKSLYEMIKRNRQMYSFAAKTHIRNAIWLVLVAAAFIAIGFWTKDDSPFRVYLIGMGLLFILGSTFAFLNSRKIARLSKGNTANPASKAQM